MLEWWPRRGTQNCADQQQEIESGAVLALALKELVLAAILGLSTYQWNLVIELDYHNTPYGAPTCHINNNEEIYIYKKKCVSDLVKKHCTCSSTKWEAQTLSDVDDSFMIITEH